MLMPECTVQKFAKPVLLLAICLVSIGCSGCSTFNAFQKQQFISQQATGPVQIQRGTPRPVIDAAGRLLGVPNRIAIGHAGVDSHNISQQTEWEISNYLEQNGLSSVLIRSNQYAPVDEWRRMVANKRIRPVWKATFGNYNLLKYTLLPGRLTGGDWYNPYTDSLHVYSDTPVLAVSRAAYAKDVRTRVNPGAYAAIKDIPLAGLSHDTTATKIAMEWYEAHPDQLESAQAILYPGYGASVGGQLASFFPYGEVIGRVVGGGLGQVANKIQNR